MVWLSLLSWGIRFLGSKHIVLTIYCIWFNSLNSTILALAVVVFFWIVQLVLIQNLIMIITLASIGALLGVSVTPITAVIILVILSFYDIVAVYKTGHMIKLAEIMIRAKAIFGFVVPAQVRGLMSSMKTVVPGEQFMILGSGDVILPLILAAALVRISLWHAAVVVVFSAVGLFIMGLLFANQKIRRPMAALPPIAAASIVGYLLVSVI